ncbi:neural cell adhesion molecule L1-like [Liolophura sinensis]|uniref:neural cell adhesion molecule L1-like n=1 Tax=Liolophura sinensis TaxID=3198878 RepID=UPI003159584D
MPENVTGHAGKNHSLPCRSRPDSKPRPALKDFNWYLGKSEIPHSRRITVDQLGNLHFLPLTVNDSAKDNAMYNCSVFNAESRARVYGSPTKLTVKSGEKPQPRSPSLVYYTESATLNAGDWLELQCIADGLPQPEVTWIPPGGSLSNRHKVDRSLYSLSVRKVKKTDEGIYACKAKNSGGEVKQTIQVTVTEELISHIYPMMMVLPEGSTQEFQCAVNEADADIAWFINNKPVGEDKRIYEYRDTLVVNNVQKPRDTFSIQCHVTKDNRTHVSDATLTVIEPIQINASDSHVDIVPGGKGHLNVSATVDPDYKDDLKYIWHHANSELKTSNLDAGIQVYPKDGFSHLTIDTSNLKASEFSNIMGEYVCEVTVGVPHATKRLKFTVTSKKAGYTLHREPASAGMSLWWLGLVGAILLVIVLTLGIIYMQIRNKGGVYLVDKRERQAGHDPVKELAEENKMQELNRSDENDDINDYQE